MTSPIIVALTATHQRTELLMDRALPSILAQTRRPDAIIVIEDGDGGTGEIPDRIARVAPDAVCLTNRRTPGLAGTTNTGLDHLARIHPDPNLVFVAFLDDDDEWNPNHLAEIEARVRDGAEVVATPLLRLEPGRDPIEGRPPEAVSPELFMAGNPYIQGSNMAARLDVLLEAGCFNEALTACNDRDLMIRLSRRPDLRFALTSETTVRYHACADRPRLSLSGSPAKLAGLDMFDMLQGPLMSPETRGKHLERAAGVFGWSPGRVREANGIHHMDRAAPEPECGIESGALAETPPLLVGVIVDGQRVESASRLLEDLAELAAREGIGSVDALLLENRTESESGEPLREMVARHRHRLRVRLIDRAMIDRVVDAGDWRPEGSGRKGRLAISDARTALQAFLHHMALERPGCAVWILDDDMRFDILTATATTPARLPLLLGRALRRMRATGADICIGTYNDAPPTPAVGSVRVQLCDLVWNLRLLGARPTDAPVPDHTRRNAELRAGRVDYHYDISRTEMDRLETPFALDPIHPEETCGEGLQRLGDMIPRIMAGEAPLRRLVADPLEMEAFETNEALHRGGNTFVFDPDALADLPNLAPTVKGRPARRSDMIWSLMQKRIRGREVISVPVPVRHDRTHLPAPDHLDHARIANDIQGYAIFRALTEEARDPDRIAELCQRHGEDRLAALRLSFSRIRGLAKEIIDWCRNGAPAHAPRGKLAGQAGQLLRMFSPDEFERVAAAVRDLDDAEVHGFLDGLNGRVERHAALIRGSNEIPLILCEARIEAERADSALAAVGAHAAPRGQIRTLGQGDEGVVVTDGSTVWKLFDLWGPDEEALAVPVLQRLVDGFAPSEALVRPTAMSRTPDGWLLSAPFEDSEPWNGGHGPGLVELLADLHGNGLAHRNLAPKNLRVAGDAVRLIDYGVDLTPVDDPEADGEEFHRMCRRAWLCWRWWWRNDLGALMRRSLSDANLPELDGHEGLIRAVRERLGVLVPRDPTMDRALELRPHRGEESLRGAVESGPPGSPGSPDPRALDYGAGKGGDSALLAGAGWEVVAWDPDPETIPLIDALAPAGVRRAASAEDAVGTGPFDLVICKRVACLVDDDDLDKVLRDLRASIAPDGRAMLTLCHPAYAHRAHVAEAAPVSRPCEIGAAGTVPWTKRIRKSGRVLHEFHRSEPLLLRRIMRAGFRVVERRERRRVEFERFETVSDLLSLELAPAPKPEVALLIKACAMDAEVLEIQTREMLSALEGPGTFRETILALDTRTEGFTREHTPGDLNEAREAARRLLDAGDVDRVVETPAPDVMRALNRRWFGLDLPATHSGGGAATGALLAGFEACGSGLVLHADVDVMIGRPDRTRDPVRELVHALELRPDALTASFPISGNEPIEWHSIESDGGKFKVIGAESRLGMVDLDRVASILPLPNKADSGSPRLSWHRAMEKAAELGRGGGLRGGDPRIAFYIHPQNDLLKSNPADWDEIRGAVARGSVPASQHREPDWHDARWPDSDQADSLRAVSPADWRVAERSERFVFVICGRNVPPERFRRCWDSVLRQNRSDWGAVVVDDASEPWIALETGHILAPHADRVSFVTRRVRAGQLANISYAVRHLCGSPGQIIVTLDSDDNLIGPGVLDLLAEKYDDGADLTVGSMLRIDKNADYPVTFEEPRLSRGGNVWQHLRSFRKGLFDGVPDERLRLDGRYVETATDWAFMIPMVEAARNPVWIREPLYLHEPGSPRDDERRAVREEVIERLRLGDRTEGMNTGACAGARMDSAAADTAAAPGRV